MVLTDGKDQTTTWKYDIYGRATNQVNHAGTEMFRYAYDGNNRLTNRWTPAKGATRYGYDAEGNVTSVDYESSADLFFSYDAVNRMTNMVDGVGTTRYSYTGFGAILTEDGPWDSDTVSYAYDNGRRRIGLAVQAPNASEWSQDYGYDVGNRLTALSSPAGNFTYDYHPGLAGSSPASLVRRIFLPNGAAITNNYDRIGRVLGTWLRNGTGSLLNQHEYIYNDLDQRTRVLRTDGSYVDYTYDALGQLQTAIGKEAGGTANRLNEQLRYAYDAADNLTNRVQHKLTNAFTVNGLNQLTGGSRSGNATAAGTHSSNATSVTVALNGGGALATIRYADHTFVRTNLTLADGTNTFVAIASDGARTDSNTVTAFLPATSTFVYDLNGNMTYDGQKALEYDDDNQLVRLIATNAWRSDFVYDGKMRRRVRREFTWQNNAWVLTNEIRYVYDRNLEIQWRDGLNLPAFTLTRGIDLSGTLGAAAGIGGLVARTEYQLPTANQSYFQADGNGNITALIDANQSVVARYLYDPFGHVIGMSGILAEANPYRFSSQEAHFASGFSCFLFRYYDPQLQRWINRDQLQERGGRNVYQFVNNSPPNAIDLFGLWSGIPLEVFPVVIEKGAECAGVSAGSTVGGAAAGLAGAAAAGIIFFSILNPPPSPVT